MKKNSSENYKLMANLDFKNADSNLYARINYKGILDGAGHTIQNIYINNTIGQPLFNSLYKDSMLLNLNIKNYNLESKSSYSAIIGSATNCKIQNLNVDKVNIKSESKVNNTVGGIVAMSSNCMFEDITIKNVNIYGKNIENVILGGFIGQGDGDINNVYINNLQVRLLNINKSTGIGGVIGFSSAGIRKINNVIVSGKIEADTGRIGGFCGRGYATISNTISNIDK